MDILFVQSLYIWHHLRENICHNITLRSNMIALVQSSRPFNSCEAVGYWITCTKPVERHQSLCSSILCMPTYSVFHALGKNTSMRWHLINHGMMLFFCQIHVECNRKASYKIGGIRRYRRVPQNYMGTVLQLTWTVKGSNAGTVYAPLLSYISS